MTWSKSSRHARGYGAAHDKMRQHLIDTVVLCEECTRQGRAVVGTIADHIKPKAQGGTDERSNYQLLCQPCSDAKTIEEAGHRARPGVDADGWPIAPPGRNSGGVGG